MVVWILWSSLLDGQDWVPYSVADGAMNEFPCPGLYGSLFGDWNQARVCTEFPGQVRPPSALQMGKAVGCALSSGATVSRAFGWALQLPVYSG